MRTKILPILTGIAFAAGLISAAASGASVATIPAGMISFPIKHGAATVLSLPLTNTESFTSTVSAVTSNTIAVADSPAPFTTNLATPASPYFVKMLSGAEAGRVLLIISNTTSVLTLDTTDHSTGTVVPFLTSGFGIQVGDSFEIFPGDTLSSIFGNGTVTNPSVLAGGTSVGAADNVTLVTTSSASDPTYYFNTTQGYWEQYGQAQSINYNNTIIYPYSAMLIERRQTNPDTTLVVTGRVTPVAAQTKVVGKGTIYTSTHFATTVTLSQLQFGANWVMGTSIATADNLSVWNAAYNRFDTFYQLPDSTWRRYPDMATDQSNFTIAAGTVMAISKHAAVTVAGTFLQSPLPYKLD